MFVFLGAVVGVLAFVPLLLSIKASKNVTKTSNFGYGALLILGVFASLIILVVAVLICYFVAKDGLLAFALAAAITLILFAIVYGIYTVIKRSKAAKERANRSKKSKGK